MQQNLDVSFGFGKLHEFLYYRVYQEKVDNFETALNFTNPFII